MVKFYKKQFQKVRQKFPKTGMFGFPRFPKIFLFLKCKGANFCLSVSYYIKQWVVQEFFSKKVLFSWKMGKKWVLLFAQSGRSSILEIVFSF